MTPLLQFEKVTKRFGDVLANDEVSFTIAENSLHGIVGENGAGKSTIMKIAYGLYPSDSGQILFKGKPTQMANPQEAIAKGIGMVHQHFMLVPTLTAWENVVLGKEEDFKKKRLLQTLEKINEDYGFSIPLEAKIENLPVGIQQQVEILKLLYRNAQVLIFDEPTAVLSPQEVHALLGKLKALKESGKTIVLITHKLKEILSFTETVTVMRQGRVVETMPTSGLNKATLAEKIIGRKHVPVLNTSSTTSDETALILDRVHIFNESAVVVSDLSLSVKRGEIVGIAGIEGNGQHEMVEAIAGVRDYRGTISLLGQPPKNSYALRQKGFAIIPPDRHREAVILDFSVEENLLLSHHREKDYLNHFLYSMNKRTVMAEKSLEEFDVRPRNPSLKLSMLSGGNQQKVVVARELGRDPQFCLAAHPTRGVDIGAIESIHLHFLRLKEKGAGILLISSELDEILSLADRILVIYRGRIQGETTRAQATESQLGLWMTGATA